MSKKNAKTLWHKTVNVIGGEGARAICEALKINTTLRVLNLNGLRQQEKKQTQKGMRMAWKKNGGTKNRQQD